MWIYRFVQNKLSWTLHLQSLSLVVCQRLVSVWMIHRKKAEFETVDGRILCTVCHDSFHNKRGISSIGYQVHVLVISYLAPVDQSRLKIIWYRSETNTSTLIIHCQCIEGWFTVASVVAERSISVRTWPEHVGRLGLMEVQHCKLYPQISFHHFLQAICSAVFACLVDACHVSLAIVIDNIMYIYIYTYIYIYAHMFRCISYTCVHVRIYHISIYVYMYIHICIYIYILYMNVCIYAHM